MGSTMTDTSEREIIITRHIDVPRLLVFEAFMGSEHLDKWWGPLGFTNETLEMDASVGGEWRFIMHGPDGVDYPNKIEYKEIVEPERIVYEHGSDMDKDPERFLVNVTFEEEEEGTKVTMRSLFPTRQQRDRVLKVGAVQAGEQSLEQLVEFLNGKRD